jgi:salicylate synthetase
MGQHREEPVSDPLKQVESAFASLPVENWTAYGYVGFDISRFYSYKKAIEQPLLSFVPETELYITTKGYTLEASSHQRKSKKPYQLIAN